MSNELLGNREIGHRRGQDFEVYSALLGHAPRIDPSAPLPAAFSRRMSDDARRLLMTFQQSCRQRAGRDDWLGSLLRRADQRLHEARRRLASPSQASPSHTSPSHAGPRVGTSGPGSSPPPDRSPVRLSLAVPSGRYLTAA